MAPVAKGRTPTSPSWTLREGPRRGGAGVAEDARGRGREALRAIGLPDHAAGGVALHQRRADRDDAVQRWPSGMPTNAAPMVSRVAVPGSVRLVLAERPLRAGAVGPHGVPSALKIGSLARGHRLGRAASAAARRSRRSRASRSPRSTPPSSRTARSSRSLRRVRSRRRSTSSIITGGDRAHDDRPARARRRGREQPGHARRQLPHHRRRGALHQRGDRSEPGRRGHRQLLPGCSAGPKASFLVTSTHVKLGRRTLVQARTITLGGALTRNDAVAVLDGEGARRATSTGCYLGGRHAAGRQPHDDRPRDAELHQPRALQGHPGRQGAGRSSTAGSSSGPTRRRPTRSRPTARCCSRTRRRSTRTRSSRSSPTT